jgi:FtsP/CotA-like multicopper oxidase with cupredoxin domain
MWRTIDMKRTELRVVKFTAVLVVMLLCCGFIPALAVHDLNTGETLMGIEGTVGLDGIRTFTLGVRCDFITTADGNSILIWGYSDESGGPGQAQYPGPTLLLKSSDVGVRINLTNYLTDASGTPISSSYDDKVSMLFSGHKATASGGTAGLLTNEVAYGAMVSYQFEAKAPGTYQYMSGTDASLQVELGMFGAMIVRAGNSTTRAYWDNNTGDADFDRQFLFLLSEMDPDVHDMVEFDQRDLIDNSAHKAMYWFINGRSAPDTLMDPDVPWLPTQPYNAMAIMEPGERVLMRVVNGGREMHPLHHHGNHGRMIARDAKLLKKPGGSGADISFLQNTIGIYPGETADVIYQWTGRKGGWDLYGPDHGDCTDALDNGTDQVTAADIAQYGCITDCLDDVTSEWCPDHGIAIPIELPKSNDLAFGGFWSGSPYLGSAANLPPGEGGLNPFSGYFHIWHSHTEKELANFDIFPGGMLTFCYIVPHGTLTGP